MAEVCFDFEEFRGDNFASLGTRKRVTFSENAIALVSVEAGGEGLFPAVDPTPGSAVLSYAEGRNFTLDITGLASEGIAGGRLSFSYTSPNLEHQIKILDAEENSLRTDTLSSTAGGTFNAFSPFSISIPADAATIQIGSRATELAIDDLRISVDPVLVAEPLAAETPDSLEGTPEPDSIDAGGRSAIVSLPGDSIEAGVRFVGVSGQSNGDATIREGGTAIAFVPSIASGEGSFDYTVRFNNQTAGSTATVRVPELRAIAGLGGDDTLLGSRGGETLDGGPDNDSIRGLTGNDTLEGGSGSDSLFGDTDGDLISGGADGDLLFGGGGNDSFNGGLGDDTLDGGQDNDTLNGGEGDDLLLGRVGADAIDGEAGNDTVQGDKGLDTLSGGGDDDLLLGGAAPDRLFGGKGDDSLFGGRDDDSLFGDVGNDSLAGDGGVDTLQGGEGQDSFNYLSPNDGGTQGDRILDFNPAEDRLVFNSEAATEGGFELSTDNTDTQTLNPGQFFTDAELVSGTFPALIYNSSTGELRYDADGSGTRAAIAIAQFEPEETGNIPELPPERIFLVNPVDFTFPELPEVVAVQDFATTPAFVNGTEGNDTLSATAAQPVNISVLDNDSPAGGLVVADIGNISGGETEIIDATTITFTPTLPAPTRGSFLYTAGDGTNSDLASVFVDIIPVETVSGLGGNDSLIGGGGDEFLLAGNGDDSLFGNRGIDVLRGETGNDLMYGGAEDDFLFGEAGTDLLLGGSGIDFLYGGGDGDFLGGESGDDFLSGDRGNDTLQGGEGSDTFAYLSRVGVGGGQQDAIADFEPGSDVLVFNRSTEDGFGFAQIGTTPETRLAPEQFVTEPNNLSPLASPILTYNQPTGTLEYDPDGSGSQAAEIVAIFDNSPFLSADDLLLVGAASDTLPPTLPGSEAVTAFALVSGTETNDVLVADEGTFTGLAVAVSVPEGSAITDAIGGTVTPLIDNGTLVEFTPTLGGGNLGSFTVSINGTSATVTVEILSAIDGLGGDDSLAGSDRDDSLFGNVGNDCLIGAAGGDTLRGGEGLDTFAYLSRTQLSSGTTSDRIADFTPGSDRLVFNNETPDGFGFEQIGETPATQLSPEQFVTDPNIPNTLASPILIYDQPTGTLEYDPDGVGTQPAEIVGIFDNFPSLSADDILLLGTSTEPISPVTANPDSATTPDSIRGTTGPDLIGTDDFDSGLNAIAIPVLANDSPAGGLTIDSLGNVVGGDATILGDTEVLFTPLPGETVGSFEYTASDNLGNTASAPVTVNISAVTAVDGLGGDDALGGAEGDDSLFGNTGNDTLQGDTGNDIIEGGFGGDFLISGLGNDIFLYRSVDEVRGVNPDFITDFDASSDQIQLTGDFSGINLISETEEIPVNEPALIYAQTTGELRYVDESNNQFVIAGFSRLPDGSFPLLDDSSILIV